MNFNSPNSAEYFIIHQLVAADRMSPRWHIHSTDHRQFTTDYFYVAFQL